MVVKTFDLKIKMKLFLLDIFRIIILRLKAKQFIDLEFHNMLNSNQPRNQISLKQSLSRNGKFKKKRFFVLF